MPDTNHTRPHILHGRIQRALDKRKLNGNLRSLDPPPYDPSTLVDFSSNDYLSLSRSTILQENLRSALAVLPAQNVDGSPGTGTSRLAQEGSHSDNTLLRPPPPPPPPPGPRQYGPASSRLLDGNSPTHLSLERRLAEFFRGQSGLLFNSGFDANAGLFACLPTGSDVVLYDELIHASTHDGMRHSRIPPANRRPFKHNDPADLERHILALLQDRDRPGLASGEAQLFVAVEALYSMDGDLAPLREFVRVVESLLPRGNGHLIVDEAHSTGLYGENGRGLTCALGLEDRVLVRLHTFGKAMACSGGER